MENESRNPNHPKKGDAIKVQPFVKKSHLDKLKEHLKHKPLDACLFALGTNTNLRASDLLQIKIEQVMGLKVPTCQADMPEIELREKKTGKARRISLNRECVIAIHGLLSAKKGKLDANAFLFEGQRGLLTVPAMNLKVKRWAKACGIKGNYGSHSLRKTFGYWKRQQGTSIPILMQIFNHATQKQTLDYLCIQPEEIREVYWNGL